MVRSQYDHVTVTAVDQLQATQDERAQEYVAQLGVGLDQLEQLVALHFDHVTGHGGGDPAEKVAAGQDRALAGEHPWREPRHVHGRGLERSDGVELPRHRSEEHTSELQSPCNLVCRLLLEKKKKNKRNRLKSQSIVT